MENVFAVIPAALVKEGKAEMFRNDFFSKYNSQPDFIAHYGFDTALLLNETAIQKTDIKQVLLNTSTEGVGGKIDFNEYGEAQIELVIVTASDRKIN